MPEGFIKHVEKLKIPFWRKIDKLVFHHTSGREDLWQGSASLLHYYNLYNSRGWKSGPHIFVGPDGIWLFTPIEKQGTHAGAGKKNSIGIEIVGRYYDGPPTNDTLCKYIALVTATLMREFELTVDDLFNHTEFEPFSNCSPFLTREWLMENSNKYAEWVNAKWEGAHATT